MRPLYAKGDTGRGETIVIVDSFGSPTIRHDLRAFDSGFGLRAPPSFRIVAPAGNIPRWRAGDAARVDWALESTLDVEWAHVMAPGASLILAETPVAETEGTAGFPQIMKAETYVIKHDQPAVISQSFAATEQTFSSPKVIEALRRPFKLAVARRVTVLAAAGDSGATSDRDNGVDLYQRRVVNWPASDPLVTAVGGTRLFLGRSGHRRRSDVVWNDSKSSGGGAGGGGVSSVFGRPSWQDSVERVVGRHRGIPDISMSASMTAGVIVYTSFRGAPAGYAVAGGTSEATPLFAGIVAVADQAVGRHLGFLNPLLYSLAMHHARRHGIVDITAGANTMYFVDGAKLDSVPGYAATRGYDLASGLGTIEGARFVAAVRGVLRRRARRTPRVTTDLRGRVASGRLAAVVLGRRGRRHNPRRDLLQGAGSPRARAEHICRRGTPRHDKAGQPSG
ncbi:MAG: S53 family peptidase [Acidimicrobiales bacterium]